MNTNVLACRGPGGGGVPVGGGVGGGRDPRGEWSHRQFATSQHQKSLIPPSYLLHLLCVLFRSLKHNKHICIKIISDARVGLKVRLLGLRPGWLRLGVEWEIKLALGVVLVIDCFCANAVVKLGDFCAEWRWIRVFSLCCVANGFIDDRSCGCGWIFSWTASHHM